MTAPEHREEEVVATVFSIVVFVVVIYAPALLLISLMHIPSRFRESRAEGVRETKFAAAFATVSSVAVFFMTAL